MFRMVFLTDGRILSYKKEQERKTALFYQLSQYTEDMPEQHNQRNIPAKFLAIPFGKSYHYFL